MKRLWRAVLMISALLVSVLAQGQPAKGLPADVRRFLEQRELCEHFANEEPYDAARRRYLARQVRRYCTGTDPRLAQLKEKYKRAPAVLTELGKLEEHTE